MGIVGTILFLAFLPLMIGLAQAIIGLIVMVIAGIISLIASLFKS